MKTGLHLRPAEVLIVIGMAVMALMLGLLATTERAAALTPVENFVDRLYLDLLGRPADPGAQVQIAFLNSNGNTQLNRQTVALQLLQTPEYRTNLVRSMYQKLLGRQPAGGEVSAGLTLLQNSGTDEQLIADIVSGNEYFNRAGSTSASFVGQLYQDLLNRPADAGAQVFITFLNNNGNNPTNRRSVASQILQSSEYRTILIGGYYQKYLRRGADPAGMTGWLNQMQLGATDEQVIAGILSSDEYFQLAQALVTPTPSNTPASTATPAIGATPTATPMPGSSGSGDAGNITPGGLGPAGGAGTLGLPSGVPQIFQNPGAVAIAGARPGRPASTPPAAVSGQPAPQLRPPSTGDGGIATPALAAQP